MGFDIFMLGATIVAAGAVTWFVLWYFFSESDVSDTPADASDSSHTSPSPTAHADRHAGDAQHPSTDQAYAEMFGSRQEEAAGLSRLVIVGTTLTAIVFVLALLSLLGSDGSPAWLQAAWIQSPWLQAILITPVMFYCGRPIHHIGRTAIARRSPDMNSLISIGTWAAYIYSLAVCIASDLMPEGSREPYFESVGVTITLVLLGRLMETKARALSDTSVQQLAGLIPDTAHILPRGYLPDDHSDSAEDLARTVASSTLSRGDLLLVPAGESIPADGVVTAGEAILDESIITGNAAGVKRESGSQVFAGTSAVSGTIVMRCTRAGRDSTLGNIVDVASHAQRSKAPVQGLTDNISRILVPVVMLIAVWTFAIWIVIGPQPRLSHAVVTAVNVLIIACPCALGLVTPLSVSAAVSLGASNGILLSSAQVLQQGTHIRTVVIDQAVTMHTVDSQTMDEREGGDGQPSGDAADAVDTLRRSGIHTILLSSSDAQTALGVAKSLGIDEVVASVRQDDKESWIRRFKEVSEDGDLVALASDGIENAAALNEADLGFAIGSGIDGMLRSADVTLVNGDLRGIPKAIQLCDITVRNIRENFAWALSFNLVAIALAVGVLYPFTGWLLNPVVAAVAMALSSLCVVLNARRLRHQVIRITGGAAVTSAKPREPRLIGA